MPVGRRRRDGNELLGHSAVTKAEKRILSPLIQRLRLDAQELWSSLKYETHYGPEFVSFPYFHAAIEFRDMAHEAIAGLDASEKIILLSEWRSKSRHPYTFTDDARILQQYEIIVLDQLVKRARQAGRRTNFDS